jgi:sortase (surface protein transpeptidase)
VALAAGCSTSEPAGPAPAASAPAQETAPAQSEPATIQIPAIKVGAPLVPLGLDKNKVIQVPDLNHVDQASWYCEGHENIQGTLICTGGGVIPGNTGPAAIYGHIDGHKRDGVFKHIMELNLGDPINIKRADGTTLTFKVYKVQQINKAQFPSSQVYGDVSRPELRLITCTGAFVGGQIGYQDQGIVYAALVT